MSQTPIPQIPQQDDGLNALLKAQQNLDKMMVLKELFDIKDIEITIAGEKHKILNQEVLTEHTNPKAVKYMVKMATWRKSLAEVMHYKDINEEQIVGYQEAQIIVKMKSYKRKGSQEIVNALKNEQAGTEVIPTNIKRKKFFGLM